MVYCKKIIAHEKGDKYLRDTYYVLSTLYMRSDLKSTSALHLEVDIISCHAIDTFILLFLNN